MGKSLLVCNGYLKVVDVGALTFEWLKKMGLSMVREGLYFLNRNRFNLVRRIYSLINLVH